MGDIEPTVVIHGKVFTVLREPGADWATLVGPRGGLLHARVGSEGWVWVLWRGRQSVVGWAVEDGPTGLRVLSEDMAGWLIRLPASRPDLSEVLLGYAKGGWREGFDLAVELIQTQGVEAALSAADLRRTIALLLEDQFD